MNSHKGKSRRRSSVYTHSNALDNNRRFQRIKSHCLEKVKRKRKQLISQLRRQRRRSSIASSASVMTDGGACESGVGTEGVMAHQVEGTSGMAFSQSLNSIIQHSVIEAEGEEDVEMGAGGGGAKGGGAAGGATLSSDEQLFLMQLLEEEMLRDLQNEADCRQLELTERAEGEYVDGAVSSLLWTRPCASTPSSSLLSPPSGGRKVCGGGSGGSPLSSAAPQIICPSCQQSYLHESPLALICPAAQCGFHLPSRGGAITLVALQQRLEHICGSHSARCAAPFVPLGQRQDRTAMATEVTATSSGYKGFSLVPRAHEGTIYLVLECAVCGTREAVV